MESMANIERLYEDSQWKNLEKQLHLFSGNENLSLADLTKEIINGDFNGLGKSSLHQLWEMIQGEWTGIMDLMVTITLIAFLSSFITMIKKSFQNKQIAEIAHYSNYLILVVLFIDLYGEIIEVCEGSLVQIEEFMRIFFPTYFMLVGTTAGIKTGLFYFQLAGLIIYFVEEILLHIMIPLLNIYMFLIFMNGIWEEERLTGIIDLMKKGILLSFKIMLAVITGISFIQSLILPVIDEIKKEGIYQFLEMLPGVGEAAKGAFRMWVGSTVLLKNSVGIVGCIILLLIVMTPIIKILVVFLALKIVASVLSIISEKTIIDCIRDVSEGVRLCFQTTGYGVLYFVILIAMSSYGSRGGF